MKDNFSKAILSTSGFGLIKSIILFITNLILIKFIDPAYFGLMALTISLLLFCQLLIEVGINSFLVTRKKIDNNILYMINTVIIILILMVNLVLVFSGSVIVEFFGDDRLNIFIPYVIITNILIGLSILPTSKLQMKHSFSRLAIVDFYGIIISSVVSVSLAIYGFILYAIIAKIFIPYIVKYILIRSEIKLKFKKPSKRFLNILMNYSRGIIGFNLVNYFSRNLDKIIIAKLLDTSVLGIYYFALQLVMVPLQLVSSNIAKISLAKMTKYKNNIDKYKEYLFINLKISTIVLFPFLLFMSTFSTQIEILNPKWSGISYIVPILSIAVLIQSLGVQNANIFYHFKKNDRLFILGSFAMIIYSLGYLIGAYYSLNYLVLGLIISSLIVLSLQFYFSYSIISLSYREFNHSLWSEFYIAVLYLSINIYIVNSFSLYIVVFIQIFVLVVYYLTVFNINKKDINKIKKVLIS